MDSANPLVWHGCDGTWLVCRRLPKFIVATPLDVIEAPEHAANGLFSGLSRNWPMVMRVHGPLGFIFRESNRNDGAALNKPAGQSGEAESSVCAGDNRSQPFHGQFHHAPLAIMAHRPVVVPISWMLPRFPSATRR